MLIEERGLTAVSDLRDVLDRPRSSVCIIVGDPPTRFTRTDWQRLSDFVRDGGAVLVASDQQFKLAGLGQFFSGPITATYPQDRYQGFADCIQIPVNAESTDAFLRVGNIVTNRSGWFEPSPMGWLKWEVVASLPQRCLPLTARGQPLLVVGRTEEQSAGVMVVSADASLLSNGMLWHGDNALAAIAIGELLCSGDRTQVLFMADQQVLGSYRTSPDLRKTDPETPPVRQLPEPELDKALRLANVIVQEVAKTNVLNEALAQQPRHITISDYFRILLSVCAVLFSLWMLRLLVRSPVQRELAIKFRSMQPAYEIRSPLNSPTGDFRNSAGYLAREFCYELTGSTQSKDWQQFLIERGSASPHRGVSPSDSVGQNLAWIVDIACRGCQVSMSRLQFQQLGKSIQSLRRKLANTSQTS